APRRGRRVLGGAPGLIELHQRVLPAGELCAESAALVPPLLGHSGDPAADHRPEVLHLLAAVGGAGGGAEAPACRVALHGGVPALLGLLEDREPGVRVAAAGVLGELSWCAA